MREDLSNQTLTEIAGAFGDASSISEVPERRRFMQIAI